MIVTPGSGEATSATTVGTATRTSSLGMVVLAVVAVIGVPLLTFWTIVFGHHTLYPADLLHEAYLPLAHGRSGTDVQVTAINDYLVAYYPARTFVSERLKAGRLPLWDPFILGGHPRFASSGAMPTLDPFNALYLVAPLTAALAWRTLLQDIACAAFMALYLTHLRVRPAAAAFGGLAFALNSMFYANIFDYSLSGILWLPLILLAVERGLAQPGRRAMVVTGLVLGVGLLACPLQFCAFTVFAVTVVGVLKWVCEHRPATSFRHVSVFLGGVVALGILISMVQMLPALELIRSSTRRITDSGQGVRSLGEMVTGTMALVTFVFPNVGGQLKGGMLLAQAWGGTTHFQGYIGLVSFLSALVAVVALPWRRTLPYVALGVGAVALVLYTPLSMFLYERFFIIYIFAAAVLAGIGLDYLAGVGIDRACVRVVVRGVLGLTGLVAVGAAVWTVVFLTFRDTVLARGDAYLVSILPERYFGNNVALHLEKLRVTLHGFTLTSAAMLVPLCVAAAACALVTARIRGRLASPSFQVLAVGLLAVDLVFMAWTHVPFVDQRKHPLFPPTPAVEYMRRDPDLFRVLALRRYGAEPPSLASGLLSAYGLHAIEGKDTLMPPNLWSILPPGLQSVPNRVPEHFNLLDATNVKYVMTGTATSLPSDRFELVHEDGVRLYRNRDVLPRAFLVSEFSVIPDLEAALAAIRDPGFEPKRLVVLARPPATPPVPGSSAGMVSVRRYAPEQVEIEVHAAAPAVLVLSDVYYPGWRATIDGVAAPIMRANVAMRAVAIPSGTHVVQFVYAPWSVAAGVAVSAATVLVVAPVLLLARRRAPRRLETA